MVTLPLVLLAIPSVVVGFMFIQPMLFGDFFKDVILWWMQPSTLQWPNWARFSTVHGDGVARSPNCTVLAGFGWGGLRRTTCT